MFEFGTKIVLSSSCSILENKKNFSSSVPGVCQNENNQPFCTTHPSFLTLEKKKHVTWAQNLTSVGPWRFVPSLLLQIQKSKSPIFQYFNIFCCQRKAQLHLRYLSISVVGDMPQSTVPTPLRRSSAVPKTNASLAIAASHSEILTSIGGRERNFQEDRAAEKIDRSKAHHVLCGRACRGPRLG